MMHPVTIVLFTIAVFLCWSGYRKEGNANYFIASNILILICGVIEVLYG